MIIVTLKYVSIIMRADNKGEGGSLALLALINRSTSDKRRWTGGIVLLGVFATALFYGDSMITPAISVLSAVEGLTTVQAGFAPYVIPISITILVDCSPSSRTHGQGRLLFAPIMLIYFVTLAVLGVMHILDHPSVLYEMLQSWNAVNFSSRNGPRVHRDGVGGACGDRRRSSVFRHGPFRAHRSACRGSTCPSALLLNYMGQGAMLLSLDPAQAIETVKNRSFSLLPKLALPLVLLAPRDDPCSQAVISGASRSPSRRSNWGSSRASGSPTSEVAAGQIYIR